MYPSYVSDFLFSKDSLIYSCFIDFFLIMKLQTAQYELVEQSVSRKKIWICFCFLNTCIFLINPEP